LAGKDPVGLAASILYLACQITGEIKTQRQIAQASGVTEVTIRNRCKDLKKKMNLDKTKYHVKKEIIRANKVLKSY
jgi:transcription initiation factor TFIIB